MSEEKANQRVEEFKREMKTLSVKLKEAEQRAENAEKQVKRLQKEVDRLEGMFPPFNKHQYYLLTYRVRQINAWALIDQSVVLSMYPVCDIRYMYCTYRALHCSFN